MHLCHTPQSIIQKRNVYISVLNDALWDMGQVHCGIYEIYRIMHELPWKRIFWSRVRWFVNDFHEWRSHGWKSLRNRFTSDQNIVIHGNEYIILFLTCYILFPEHTILLKTIIGCSFRHCRQGQSFLTKHCDVTTVDLWHHANAKYWHCDVIHICQLFLHAPIRPKAIFTSEWQPWISISHHPAFTA